MVFLITISPEESQSSVKCAVEGCKGTGSMLKCSSESCKNYLHVSCAKFQSDEEASKAPFYHCSTKCRPKTKDNAGGSKETIPKSPNVDFLEKKLKAQKATINSLVAKCDEVQKANDQYQEDMKRILERLKFLEDENQRIKKVEEELAEMKKRNGFSSESKHELDAKQEDFEPLESLLEYEEDDDFKRRLTEVFKKKTSDPNASCHVFLNDQVKDTSKMDITMMNETQKLAYYQRLHVQRLDAPKLNDTSLKSFKVEDDGNYVFMEGKFLIDF